MEKEGLSIVICCYNSESRIAYVLKYLSLQKFKVHIDIEILVIDNNSSDNTKLMAYNTWERLGSPFLMKVIFEGQQGLIYARKSGIRNSIYENILFVDDDNLLKSNYVCDGYELLIENPEIGILGGIGIGEFSEQIPTWINPGWPFKSLLSSLAVSVQSRIKIGYLSNPSDYIFGAASFYRKKIFSTLEDMNYDIHLTGRKGNMLISGEDQELCYLAKMMGLNLYRSDKIEFFHKIPTERLTKVYFEKLYFGFGYSSIIIDKYISVLSEKSFNLNRLTITTKFKKIILSIFDNLLTKSSNKFFKLKLLKEFEQGRIEFLNSSIKLQDTLNSIDIINKKLTQLVEKK